MACSLWESSLAVLREALAEAGASARDAAALGVATQRSTALAWDARSGEPLAPAIGWQDQRTAARAEELQARGVPMPVQASATKLEWLLQSESRVAEAARAGRLRLGTPDVWLTDRLTGGSRFVTDPSCASATCVPEENGEGHCNWTVEHASCGALDYCHPIHGCKVFRQSREYGEVSSCAKRLSCSSKYNNTDGFNLSHLAKSV